MRIFNDAALRCRFVWFIAKGRRYTKDKAGFERFTDDFEESGDEVLHSVDGRTRRDRSRGGRGAGFGGFSACVLHSGRVRGGQGASLLSGAGRQGC